MQEHEHAERGGQLIRWDIQEDNSRYNFRKIKSAVSGGSQSSTTNYGSLNDSEVGTLTICHSMQGFVFQ